MSSLFGGADTGPSAAEKKRLGDEAAEKERKRARLSQGRRSTILSDEDSEQEPGSQRKTVLGG